MITSQHGLVIESSDPRAVPEFICQNYAASDFTHAPANKPRLQHSDGNNGVTDVRSTTCSKCRQGLPPVSRKGWNFRTLFGLCLNDLVLQAVYRWISGSVFFQRKMSLELVHVSRKDITFLTEPPDNITLTIWLMENYFRGTLSLPHFLSLFPLFPWFEFWQLQCSVSSPLPISFTELDCPEPQIDGASFWNWQGDIGTLYLPIISRKGASRDVQWLGFTHHPCSPLKHPDRYNFNLNVPQFTDIFKLRGS